MMKRLGMKSKKVDLDNKRKELQDSKDILPKIADERIRTQAEIILIPKLQAAQLEHFGFVKPGRDWEKDETFLKYLAEKQKIDNARQMEQLNNQLKILDRQEKNSLDSIESLTLSIKGTEEELVDDEKEAKELADNEMGEKND